MQNNQRFKMNNPQVIGEVIEGEAVIVSLETGAYYSLQGTGGVIWTLMEQGMTIEEMIACMTEKYEGDPDTIRSVTLNLLEELQQDGLICSENKLLDARQVHSDTFTSASRPLFQSPALVKYTDMADLLLLDPIHEVDEIGWPHPETAPIQSAIL